MFWLITVWLQTVPSVAITLVCPALIRKWCIPISSPFLMCMWWLCLHIHKKWKGLWTNLLQKPLQIHIQTPGDRPTSVIGESDCFMYICLWMRRQIQTKGDTKGLPEAFPVHPNCHQELSLWNCLGQHQKWAKLNLLAVEQFRKGPCISPFVSVWSMVLASVINQVLMKKHRSQTGNSKQACYLQLACSNVLQHGCPFLIGSYGLPKPWYFPLTRSYWCGHPRTEIDLQCTWRMCCPDGHTVLSVREEDQACAMGNGGQGKKQWHFPNYSSVYCAL